MNLTSIASLTLAIGLTLFLITLSPPQESFSSPSVRRLQSEQLDIKSLSPKIAWLMSFPNSGTTFTQHAVQDVSEQSIASFYGHEWVTREGHTVHNPQSTPVHAELPDGPFVLSDYPLPKSGYILSKTHCGGYCFSDCPPSWFILTPQKFLNECTTGARFEKKDDSSERIWVHYDPQIISKAVHIFRDPYDNIISRFHHECKLRQRNSDQVKWEREYNNDEVGFRQWCDDSSVKFKEQLRWLFDVDTLAAFESVPCHNEFFRYVQWHNNAFAVTRNLNVPVLVVHYQDYHDRLSETVDGILDFLEQPRVKSQPPPFKLKTYNGYYTEQDKEKIQNLIEFLATKETWGHLQRYFNQ